MSHTMESLGIDRLSVADRLRLAEEIWDSIADSVESTDIPDRTRRNSIAGSRR